MQGERAFAYTRGQRRTVLLIAAGFGIGGIGLIVASVLVSVHQGSLDGNAAWGLVGLLCLPTSALSFRAGRAVTRIDATGLHARRMWQHWDFPWTEITAIDKAWETAPGASITRIRITSTNRRPFKLPAPLHAGAMTADPDFDAKLAVIRQAWRAGRKADT